MDNLEKGIEKKIKNFIKSKLEEKTFDEILNDK